MKLSSPLPQGLPKECNKAIKIFQAFADDGRQGLDGVIPRHVLTRAKGFAFLSVVKAGFVFSARAGTGLVLAKLEDGTWSAPSAIGTAGMGFGGQAGAEVTDYLFVLNSRSAVRSFMSAGSITLGGSLSVAVGPIGRTGEAQGSLSSSGQVAAMYTYSKTKGLFGGVSIEGSVIAERQETNCIAYQSNVTAQMLLSGMVPIPQWAEPLIRCIEVVTGQDAGRRWVKDEPSPGISSPGEYAFGGLGSPDGIKKKKGTPTPGTEWPPKSWGIPKNGGSYFDSWADTNNDNNPSSNAKAAHTPSNGVGGKELDLMDFNDAVVQSSSVPKTGPFSHMTSPFDTTNADIRLSMDRITSPFDTSGLKRPSSGGNGASGVNGTNGGYVPAPVRPKPVRGDSEASIKMKARAAQLSSQLENDVSFLARLSPFRSNPSSPTQQKPSQAALIQYDDGNHLPFQHNRNLSDPTSARTDPDPNLPFHLQEVHVDLDKTNINVDLPSPTRSRGSKGSRGTPPLIKSSFVRKAPKAYSSDSSEGEESEDKLPKHRRAPSQRFKAALKAPIAPEGVGRAIVRFDFDAIEPEDLTMRKGDIVLILERTSDVNDWWKGKIDNRVGNFPANFVEVVGAPSNVDSTDPMDPF